MPGNEDVVKVIAPYQLSENGSYTILVTGEREKISTSKTVIRSIRLRADKTNSGNIEIGSDNLTANNSVMTLRPDKAIEIFTNNIQNINIIGTATDKLNFQFVI